MILTAVKSNNDTQMSRAVSGAVRQKPEGKYPKCKRYWPLWTATMMDWIADRSAVQSIKAWASRLILQVQQILHIVNRNSDGGGSAHISGTMRFELRGLCCQVQPDFIDWLEQWQWLTEDRFVRQCCPRYPRGLCQLWRTCRTCWLLWTITLLEHNIFISCSRPFVEPAREAETEGDIDLLLTCARYFSTFTS